MRRQIFRWTVFFVGLTSTRQGRGRLPKAKSAEVSPPSRVLEARVSLIYFIEINIPLFFHLSAQLVATYNFYNIYIYRPRSALYTLSQFPTTYNLLTYFHYLLLTE